MLSSIDFYRSSSVNIFLSPLLYEFKLERDYSVYDLRTERPLIHIDISCIITHVSDLHQRLYTVNTCQSIMYHLKIIKQ